MRLCLELFLLDLSASLIIGQEVSLVARSFVVWLVAAGYCVI